MELQTIERTARRRRRLLLWITVGFGLFWPAVALGFDMEGRAIRVILGCLGGVGAVILIPAAFALSRLMSKMGREPELRKALTGEKYKANVMKSFQLGFFITMFVAVVAGEVLRFCDAFVPVSIVCFGLFYVGILSLFIASLILNRTKRVNRAEP